MSAISPLRARRQVEKSSPEARSTFSQQSEQKQNSRPNEHAVLMYVSKNALDTKKEKEDAFLPQGTSQPPKVSPTNSKIKSTVNTIILTKKLLQQQREYAQRMFLSNNKQEQTLIHLTKKEYPKSKFFALYAKKSESSEFEDQTPTPNKKESSEVEDNSTSSGNVSNQKLEVLSPGKLKSQRSSKKKLEKFKGIMTMLHEKQSTAVGSINMSRQSSTEAADSVKAKLFLAKSKPNLPEIEIPSIEDVELYAQEKSLTSEKSSSENSSIEEFPATYEKELTSPLFGGVKQPHKGKELNIYHLLSDKNIPRSNQVSDENKHLQKTLSYALKSARKASNVSNGETTQHRNLHKENLSGKVIKKHEISTFNFPNKNLSNRVTKDAKMLIRPAKLPLFSPTGSISKINTLSNVISSNNHKHASAEEEEIAGGTHNIYGCEESPDYKDRDKAAAKVSKKLHKSARENTEYRSSFHQIFSKESKSPVDGLYLCSSAAGAEQMKFRNWSNDVPTQSSSDKLSKYYNTLKSMLNPKDQEPSTQPGTNLKLECSDLRDKTAPVVLLSPGSHPENRTPQILSARRSKDGKKVGSGGVVQLGSIAQLHAHGRTHMSPGRRTDFHTFF
jgi:hypothetical protein